MATGLSKVQDAADASEIAKEIVDTSESSDSEIVECGSVFSVETGENEVNAHGNETGSELNSVSTTEHTAISILLDALRPPKLSEISRKRKTYNNSRGGTRRKTRNSSSSASEPKTVKPQQ